jgi:glycyl-tRNA synthetase beta chain
MTEKKDLLIEIGTEELPPLSLRRLSESFKSLLSQLLDEHELKHGAAHAYASPRRLAVHIEQVPLHQPDREVIRRGPALTASFDENGNPTRPAEGFARSCGVTVAELDQLETGKGSWLAWRVHETGKPTEEIIPELIERALKTLPTPKRMRWADRSEEFVRPAHWIVLLLGEKNLKATILGLAADRYTRGHRFHCNEKLPVREPAVYVETLEKQGHVLVDMDQRRDCIRTQVLAAARDLGGSALIDEALLEEVTALVEWPAVITGGFDRRYLEIPAEALISSMQHHQKFFPVVDGNGELMPNFITVANIESKNPALVKAGNERVIRPRLEDAAFFWNQDRRQPLQHRAAQLDTVTFQQQLGSLGDKQRRIEAIASFIAGSIGSSVDHAERAASLCKCDLLTSMVYEFPELQGVMGRYYATHDGEPAEVATALDEQYQPRFAGDTLPATRTGQALAIADRLDTLTGIFAIGQPPSGDKDPFGLRRAALGVLRIMIEHELDLDLHELIAIAAAILPPEVKAAMITDKLFGFMMERLRAYYLDTGYDGDIFEAVLARRPVRPIDFDHRMRAVQAFRNLPESESLASANKRIRNILRKSGSEIPVAYESGLLEEGAERDLARAIDELDKEVTPFFEQRAYTEALCRLAALRDPVDRYFDSVMVMVDDAQLRHNRLALLNALSDLFLRVADISRLQA